MSIDMSPPAITARLKLVSQLRRLCLALGQAKGRATKSEAPTFGSNPGKRKNTSKKELSTEIDHSAMSISGKG